MDSDFWWSSAQGFQLGFIGNDNFAARGADYTAALETAQDADRRLGGHPGHVGDLLTDKG